MPPKKPKPKTEPSSKIIELQKWWLVFILEIPLQILIEMVCHLFNPIWKVFGLNNMDQTLLTILSITLGVVVLWFISYCIFHIIEIALSIRNHNRKGLLPIGEIVVFVFLLLFVIIFFGAVLYVFHPEWHENNTPKKIGRENTPTSTSSTLVSKTPTEISSYVLFLKSYFTCVNKYPPNTKNFDNNCAKDLAAPFLPIAPDNPWITQKIYVYSYYDCGYDSLQSGYPVDITYIFYNRNILIPTISPFSARPVLEYLLIWNTNINQWYINPSSNKPNQLCNNEPIEITN